MVSGTGKPVPPVIQTLCLNPGIDNLFEFRYEDFELTDYRFHEHIKAAVAV